MGQTGETTVRRRERALEEMIRAGKARVEIEHAGGLIGVAGLTELWGVTRQRVSELSGLPGFPQPLAIEGKRPRGGDVWLRSECVAWKTLRDLR